MEGERMFGADRDERGEGGSVSGLVRAFDATDFTDGGRAEEVSGSGGPPSTRRVSRAVDAICSTVIPRMEASSMLASVAAVHCTRQVCARACAPRVVLRSSLWP